MRAGTSLRETPSGSNGIRTGAADARDTAMPRFGLDGALNQLEKIRGRYALCTMCIGVGQGIAMVIERV